MNNTIVLVVDMLNDFVQPVGKLYVPGAEKLVPRIRKILDASHTIGVQVVYACDAHAFEDPEFKTWPRHCVKGTDGARITFGLEPVTAYDLVIKKQTLSVVDTDEFKQLLDALASMPTRKTIVIVVGVATEYCVRAAVLDIKKYMKAQGCDNTVMTVVTDCIAGVNLQPGDVDTALMEMGLAGAAPIKSEDLLKAFEETPEVFTEGPEVFL